MKYTTYAGSKFDLDIIKDAGLNEVIIAPKELNRLSKNSQSEFLELLTRARELGLRVILEWDILINEVDFEKCCEVFNTIATKAYDVIRVQDAGVLEYVLENSKKPIQLILENGNHNLAGIQKWVSYVGKRLDRIILSIELSKDLIQSYREELECDIEILVLGRVLLFYSPRKLLSPLKGGDQEGLQEFIEAVGESEESPHKGFPIIENTHGSFMFHIKDLFLLDRIEEVEKIGIDFARVDLRFNDIGFLTKIMKAESGVALSELKEEYGVEVIRGYFQTNKSDVLFKKLKNSRLQRQDQNYLGEILEARKSEFMAIHLKGEQGISIGQELKFITPEGKEHFCKVHTLKDLELNDMEQVSVGKLALINYMSGVWVKSQVYLQN